MYSENEMNSMLKDIARLEEENYDLREKNYDLREENKALREKLNILEKIIFETTDFIDSAYKKIKESERV